MPHPGQPGQLSLGETDSCPGPTEPWGRAGSPPSWGHSLHPPRLELPVGGKWRGGEQGAPRPGGTASTPEAGAPPGRQADVSSQSVMKGNVSDRCAEPPFSNSGELAHPLGTM